jgi:capsular polysaccharide biosynthesis protein
MESNDMKDNDNQTLSPKTMLAIIGFVLGVLTVVALLFIKKC